MNRKIKPVKELNGVIDAPSSKSYTHRAMFIAALADGRSTLKNPLIADDMLHAEKALSAFGVRIERQKDAFLIDGMPNPKTPSNVIDIGNSGMTIRTLTSFAALTGDGYTILTGIERMTKRPVGDLIDALQQLGVQVFSARGDGNPPIIVKGGGIPGGIAKMKGGTSSQFFSSILISSPYAKNNVQIKTIGEMRSKPYVDMTIEAIREFGVEVQRKGYEEFSVESGQSYKPKEYQIEGDFSNASYFFATAAITGGKVKVTNLNPNSLQGDKIFVEHLKDMGCKIRKGNDWIEVEGGELRGITVDMSDTPDIVQTLAVTAAFAKGETKIMNIEHLRYKETDRLKSTATELKKMGIKVEELKDSLIIHGGKPKGATIETYDDHRMAMSFAVAGLAVLGIVIKNPECVSKSFPNFFNKLNELTKI